MSTENRCPECGIELAANAPGGLCPACLLKKGLQTNTAATGTGASSGDKHFVPPTPAELAPYFPELEILDLIGCGGMGVVYRAKQKRLDRLVALKILSPRIGQDPAFAERFAREAKAMALLSHPHIVAVHDFGQRPFHFAGNESEAMGQASTPSVPSGIGAEGAGHLYFFIMEYVDGVNLRQLLDTGKLAPQQALAIVPQICEALQFAHDHGVVHRDIKPENILLDKNGRVKIADFGLAKLVGRVAEDISLSATNQVMGTPYYMAPEQTEHPREVDHRADIYSLGVVFYQMLTGELPLGRFEAPSKRVQIDVRLDEVVLRALEKEPGRRYQQVSEIKTQIETISTSQPPPDASIEATPITRTAGARFSKAAIFGAAWAPFFFVVLLFTFTFTMPVKVPVGTEPPGPVWWQTLLAFTVLPLGILAPFGTTILGAVALTQIRHSAGKLFGLGLALFDALLFPLLVLDGLLGSLVYSLLQMIVQATNHANAAQGKWPNAVAVIDPIGLLFTAVIIFLLVDIPIVIKAWRAACKPIGNGSKPVSPQPDSTLVRPQPAQSPADRAAIEQAMQQVQAPAIGLLIMGILQSIAFVPLVMLLLPFCARVNAGAAMQILPILFLLFWLIGSILSIVAAVKMKQLRAYGLSVAGTILAILGGNPLGLAIGIWALVILCQTEVRKAFWTNKSLIPPDPVPVNARRFGLTAFLLCFFGIPISFLIANLVVSANTGVQISWAGIFLPFLFIQLVALIFGIVGRKSGLGLAAAIISSMLLLISVPVAIYAAWESTRKDFGGFPSFVSLKKADSELLLQQGWDLLDSGRVEEAREKFEQCIQNAPDKPNAWNGLGWANFNLGNLHEAEMDFKKELGFVTTRPAASNGLGQIYLIQKKYKDAESYLLKAAPKAPAAWYGLAKLYLLQSKFEEAEKWAQKIVDSNPSDEGAKKLLQAAKDKHLSDELRKVIEGSEAKPEKTTATFGSVITQEITSQDCDDQGLVFFSLKNGKPLKPPFPLKLHPNQLPDIVEFTPELKKWIAANDLDIMFHLEEKSWSMVTLEMEMSCAGQENQWRTILPEKILEDFAKADARGMTHSYLANSNGGNSYTNWTMPSAFRTRNKSVGLCQFEGFQEPSFSWHGILIRYKFIQDSAYPSASPENAEKSETEKKAENSKGQFGSVVERVVYDWRGTLNDACIDLDRNIVASFPADLMDKINQAKKAGDSKSAKEMGEEWARMHGMDAGAQVHLQDPRLSNLPAIGLIGQDMFATSVDNAEWDRITPIALESQLSEAKLKDTRPDNVKGEMISGGNFPVTYLFQTREGGKGVLQLISFNESPKYVKIRYKMIQGETNKLSPPKEAKISTEPQGPKLIYEIEPNSETVEVSDIIRNGNTAILMDGLLNIVDRRLNAGVEKVAVVRRLDDRRLEVALLRNNDDDKKRVERLLARAGTLDFRILATERDKEIVEQANKDSDVLDGFGKRLAYWVPLVDQTANGFAKYPKNVVRTRKEGEREIAEILVLNDSCNRTGIYLKNATAENDSNGRPCINFTFNQEGGKLLAKLTGDHLPDKSDPSFSYQLGIILDGKLQSAPNIRSTISAKGLITGNFTKEETADLADILNAGSLPVRLKLVDEPSSATPDIGGLKPVPAEAAIFYDSMKAEVEKAAKALNPDDVEGVKDLPAKFEQQNKKLEEMLKGTVAEVEYAKLKGMGASLTKKINEEKDERKKQEMSHELIDISNRMESLIYGKPHVDKPFVIPLELALEDDAKEDITISLERDNPVLKTLPGSVQLDLTGAIGGEHLLYFYCPGYAAQWVRVGLVDHPPSPSPIRATLFRTRYVVLKCAFNERGGRNLEGEGVKEQRVVLTHWHGVEPFRRDWQLWQSFHDNVLTLNFHRVDSDYGFAKPASGETYETMKEAPLSGYKCENVEAAEGLVLYNRIKGELQPNGLGYGKILVESISETPPSDMKLPEEFFPSKTDVPKKQAETQEPKKLEPIPAPGN